MYIASAEEVSWTLGEKCGLPLLWPSVGIEHFFVECSHSIENSSRDDVIYSKCSRRSELLVMFPVPTLCACAVPVWFRETNRRNWGYTIQCSLWQQNSAWLTGLYYSRLVLWDTYTVAENKHMLTNSWIVIVDTVKECLRGHYRILVSPVPLPEKLRIQILRITSWKRAPRSDQSATRNLIGIGLICLCQFFSFIWDKWQHFRSTTLVCAVWTVLKHCTVVQYFSTVQGFRRQHAWV